jgi:NIMA-interacting peptidyl-prolyl cis-trans isomerase 4
MPPKKGAASKDKGKAKDTSAESSADKKGKGGGDKKLKPATSINVRHILCEKHSKKEEALVKLNAGTKFDEVAREFSEDKARQGELLDLPARLIGSIIQGTFEFGERKPR